jgi:hypothetical protein
MGNITDGSLVRLADVAEVTIGTTPSTPSFKIRRYERSDLRLAKQVDIPNEVRADRNVGSIVDVGRQVQGSIDTLLSYGTYDDWFAYLFQSTWATNVLKNGITPATATIEEFFEQGATDTFVRYTGVRWNTLDLTLAAQQSVSAKWGLMGITAADPATAAISGATYAAASTTDVFNAGLNVGSLGLTGISNSPLIKSLSLRINNNIYPNYIVGQYAPQSHGLGRFELTGSMDVYFSDKDTYQAVVSHTTVALAFTLQDAASNSYQFSIPKVKLTDGGPPAVGNGQPVMMTVPFQAFYDSGIGASISITRSS